jgi:Molybdate transporter of MFS superfamily
MEAVNNDKSFQMRNRFDRMEIAGAFGDLGTLIPFVVAYIGVLKMDPFGVLLSFGMAMVVCGFIYRTPMPVQPMKAVGAIAATQAAQTPHHGGRGDHTVLDALQNLRVEMRLPS